MGEGCEVGNYLVPADLSTGPGSASFDVFEDFVGLPFFAADLGVVSIV